MNPQGEITTLAEFGSSTASFPAAALVEGPDGSLYGTTELGGTGGHGTVFKITPVGALTILVNFTNNGASNKGRYPRTGLVVGPDGNLYGVTAFGGAGDFGTVFRMTPAGILTTLVEFTLNGASNKGAFPYGDLLLASDGNFYGTTYLGGSGGGGSGSGTIFRMTPAGVLTTLIEFTRTGGASKGAGPKAGMIEGTDGMIYGTTELGGTADDGTIFKMTTSGTLITLVEFDDDGTEIKGRAPLAPLRQGADGYFYGTTQSGGAQRQGTVFRMTGDGMLTTFVEFGSTATSLPGRRPVSGLELGADGYLYGTTPLGGLADYGTIFRLSPTGDFETVSVFGGLNGVVPLSGLELDIEGCFLGSTSGGGLLGQGTIFKLTPAGAFETRLHFTGSGAASGGAGRGGYPNQAALLRASDGFFYGVTYYGGSSGNGTVFKLGADGSHTTLVDFSNNGTQNKGKSPQCRLLEHEGMFYGTTNSGGAANLCTVFKMTSGGVVTTLVEFTGNGASNKGKGPSGGLTWFDGHFYGTTMLGGTLDRGTIFKMTPDGVLTTLVEFTGNGAVNKGQNPGSELLMAADGYFYGVPSNGRASSKGTVFRMTPGGVLTTLVEFTGNGASNKGQTPVGSLVQGMDGNIYGSTRFGGIASGLGRGTIFSMTTGGVLTTLFDFSQQTDDCYLIP